MKLKFNRYFFLKLLPLAEDIESLHHTPIHPFAPEGVDLKKIIIIGLLHEIQKQ